MTSTDTFQQVKTKVDQLAKIRDILANISKASSVTLDISFPNEQARHAFYRLEDTSLSVLKESLQSQANTLWTDIQELTKEPDGGGSETV